MRTMTTATVFLILPALAPGAEARAPQNQSQQGATVLRICRVVARDPDAPAVTT